MNEIDTIINKNVLLSQFQTLNIATENVKKPFLTALKSSCKMYKNSIRMKRSIEFHLPHYEIPKLS